MDELRNLGSSVRAARKKRLWRQEDLAEKAGVSVGMVSNLERGNTRPQPGNEAAILQALGLEKPEPNLEEGERDWPDDVAVVLDVIGLVLTSIPDEERPAEIRELTRFAMARHGQRRPSRRA